MANLMPQDKALIGIGRTYHGEAAVPITTSAAVAAAMTARVALGSKLGAVPIHVYFVGRGIDNPILQASMLAYTDVRVAPPEDFDEIFVGHHEVSVPKPVDGGKHQ